MEYAVSATEYLIVCPLVFLAGLVDAVAGGGGLISLPAYMIAGLPPHIAMGTNKLSSCMGTAMATFRYTRLGYIDWRLALPCVPCALAASALGARLALSVPENALRLILLVVLPLTALYVMRARDLGAARPPLAPPRALAAALGASFAVGVYDGFYGPGTGTFLILLLTGVARMSLTSANGLTKAINFSTNVAALAVLALNDKAVPALGLAAGAFCAAGNYAGTRLFAKGGAKAVRPLIVLVLSIFFARVVWELIR